jgi:Biopolymer transport protein ExbD/TolR
MSAQSSVGGGASLGEDTSLNMTPMIDVVFQLMLFFLLTLRFSTPQDRIESQLPKNVGPRPTPQVPVDVENVKVKLFRVNKTDADEAHTKIRVGNHWEIALPKGRWTGDAARDADLLARHDEVFRTLAAKIAEEWSNRGRDPDVRGEIAAPPPDGPAVPHGDVVRVLDSFLAVGLTQVAFEGARAPLPTSEGGTMFN